MDKIVFKWLCTLVAFITMGVNSVTMIAQGTPEWRPLHVRPIEYVGAGHVDFPHYYAKGKYYGEGMQFIQGASAHEDGTVLMAQDMGSARISRNFGHTWYTPENKGNPQIGGNSCAIDPDNSNIMFISMSAKYRSRIYPGLTELEGIYRSEDMGESWEHVLSIPAVQDVRFFMDNFACFPVSGGIPEDRVWRFASSNKNKAGEGRGGQIWKSEDGKKWTKVGDLPDIGSAYSLVQHPELIDVLYLCADNGLFRTQNGGKTWTTPWKNMLRGRAYSLWIDPDNVKHMIISIMNNTDNEAFGIWETNDSGEQWSRILGDINPLSMAVGAKNAEGKRMIYVHNSVSAGKARIRTFNGEWVIPESNTLTPHLWMNSSITGQTMSCFLPHPTIPDLALCHGRAFWWRSQGTNGTIWDESSTNFFGSSFREVAFNESDWRQMYVVCSDTGMEETLDGGDSFEKINITGREPGGQWQRMRDIGLKANARTGRSIICLPDPWPSSLPPPTDPGAPGRQIMTLGPINAHCIFFRDKGRKVWDDLIEKPVEEGGHGVSRRLFYSRQNPNIIYAGPNISRDAGKTWGMMEGKMHIAAMSHINGDIIYAVKRIVDGNSIIYRSINQGSTWEEIFVADWNLLADTRYGRVKVDPSSDDRLYTYDSKGDLLLLQKNRDGRWEKASLNLQSMYTNIPFYWDIADIVVDANEPGLIYVLVDVSGDPTVWIGRLNHDFSVCEWQDITLDVPRIAGSSNIHLHPITGDLIVSTGNGTFVYPAPDNWQHKDTDKRQYKRALWENMPLPIPKIWK